MSKSILRLLILITAATVPAVSLADDEAPDLSGTWEIYRVSGGRVQWTGMLIRVEQSGNHLTATYAQVPPDNRRGIRPGFDFFRATMKGPHGRGRVTVRKGDVRTGEPVSITQEPLRLLVGVRDGQPTVRGTIEGSNVLPAESIFVMDRPAPVKALRLFVKTPSGLQGAREIIEGVPMVVEVERERPAPSSLEVTLASGPGRDTNALRLTATPTRETTPERRNRFFRTREFLPTFGRSLGADPGGAREEASEEGRPPTSEEWARLEGTWKTAYEDAVRKRVTGFATVSADGRVDLRTKDPRTGFWQRLELEQALVKDEMPAGEASAKAGDESPGTPPPPPLTWVLRFRGQGVTSDRIPPRAHQALPELRLDAERPAPVRIRAGDARTHVDLTRRQPADTEHVTLELTRRLSKDLYAWSWRYLADRGTARDGAGLGRVGVLLPPMEDASVATMAGRELWLRSPTRVLAAVCVDDQLAKVNDPRYYGGPVERYRFATRDRVGRNVNGETVTDRLEPSGRLGRLVFAEVADLPPGDVDDIDVQVVKQDPGGKTGVQKYRVKERGSALRKSDEFYRAWNRYDEIRKAGAAAEGEDPPEKALEEGRERTECVLLWAELLPDTPPGYQPFTLNGAEGRWRLLYGDTIGTLEVVRMLAESDEEGEGEWEPVDPAFVPERLRISVKCTVPIESRERIEAAVSVDKALGTWKGEKTIPLTRDPNEPTRYLSPPIELVLEKDAERFAGSEGAITLPARNGSRLRVMVGPDPGYLVLPITRTVRILDRPARLNAEWKAAVLKAARLANQPVHDWNKVARGKAGAVTHFFVTEWLLEAPLDPTSALGLGMEDLAGAASRFGFELPLADWWRSSGRRAGVREIPISIGDHAAMLLLRKEFIRMMNEMRADWSRNQSQEKINRIYWAQKDAVGAQRSPLSFATIRANRLSDYSETDEDDEVYLFQVFDDEFVRDEMNWPDDRPGRYRLRQEAFGIAYRDWGGKMKTAVQEAANIDDADPVRLLKLTGAGFEHVAARVIPRLMKLEDAEGEQRMRWVPDRVARAYLRGVTILGAAARAQEEYSELDTTVALVALSLVTIPLGNAGGIWTTLAALSAGAVDLGHAIYTDLYGNSLRKEELQTEVGMGAVLGHGRAAALKAKVKEGWEQALSVGGALVGVGGDAVIAARAVRAARALELPTLIDRGTDLIRSIDFANPDQLRKLGKADQALLARYADHADALLRAGRSDELSDMQRQALKHRREIDDALGELTEPGATRPLGEPADAPPLPLQPRRSMDKAELVETGEQLDELVKGAKADLARPGIEDAECLAARDRLSDLKVRQVVQRQLQKEARRGSVELTESDRALLRGERMGLNDVDRAQVRDAIRRHDWDWGKIKKLEEGSGEDKLLLHKIGMWRRAEINRLADEAMEEARQITGHALKRKALGSTDLTSDYDVSIAGRGSQLAVAGFVRKARKYFGDRESGFVIDSNIYTDPIYGSYRARNLSGTESGLTRVQYDDTRQFLFQQMANAKYRTPGQWKAFRGRVLDDLPPDARKSMGDLLDQAEGARAAGESRIRRRLAELGVNADRADDASRLRVNNDLYADGLEDIYRYGEMVDHLRTVGKGPARAVDTPLPAALRGEDFDRLLKKLDRDLGSTDRATRRAAEEGLAGLRDRAALALRSKQGEALYYAAEAYQARGTIGHVVNELQAGGVRWTLKADEMLDGVRRKTDLRPDDYVNSYYENAANMTKEMFGKHVIDDAGRVAKGLSEDKLQAAARKASKYFARQIDGAQMAGVDLRRAGIDDVDDLVHRTLALDRTRGDEEIFKQVLAGGKAKKAPGWPPRRGTPPVTAEEYVRRVIDATERLDAAVVKQSSVVGLSTDLSKVESFATRRARDLLRGRPAWAPPVRRPRWADPGEETERARREHDAGPGAEYEQLRALLASGRHLTPAQRSRMVALRSAQVEHDQLERLATAARLAGVSQGEVDAVVRDARGAAPDGAWRGAARDALDRTIERRVAETPPRRDPSALGATSARLRETLGIADASPADRSHLESRLRSAGHRVIESPGSPVPPERLAAHLDAGRYALVMVDRPGSDGPTWTVANRVARDASGRRWIVTEDAETGAEVAWPEAVLAARARAAPLIIDPFQTPDGRARKAPARSAREPDPSDALPLAGEEVPRR